MSPPYSSSEALRKELRTLYDSVEFLSNGMCSPFLMAELLRYFLQRDPQRRPQYPDIHTSQFKGMAIADEEHQEFVSKYFKQYPVLFIDLKVNLHVFLWKLFKDVAGDTFASIQNSFDTVILDIAGELKRHNPLLAQEIANFLQPYENVDTRATWRLGALKQLSQILHQYYDKRVIVLIDEYDTPMHHAIRHGYTTAVCFILIL